MDRKIKVLFIFIIIVLMALGLYGYFQANNTFNQNQISDNSTISENGQYNSRDDVALYIEKFHKLPSNYITKAMQENQDGRADLLRNMHLEKVQVETGLPTVRRFYQVGKTILSVTLIQMEQIQEAPNVQYIPPQIMISITHLITTKHLQN